MKIHAGLTNSPSKRIPEATHSKTLRRDSPAPIGLSDVAIAFSTSSSRSCAEKKAEVTHYSSRCCCLKKQKQTPKNKKQNKVNKEPKKKKTSHGFDYRGRKELVYTLTHPDNGVQVGTRLHKSLMIRITITAEVRSLTLAWRHK